MSWDKYFKPATCEICGLHIGNHFNHTECSKKKKEMHADKRKAKRAVPKYKSEKQIESFLKSIGE